MIQNNQMNQFNNFSKSNYESKPIKFKFHKSRVIAETNKTILINITHNIGSAKPKAVWVAKKLLYASNWLDTISAYIPNGFTFKVDNTNVAEEISGEQLKELISCDNL